MNDFVQHIEINPDILQGKPIVRGRRVPVSLVLGYLAGGMTADEILAEYPTITEDHIRACLAYARDVIDAEEIPRFAECPVK